MRTTRLLVRILWRGEREVGSGVWWCGFVSEWRGVAGERWVASTGRKRSLNERDELVRCRPEF